MVKNELIEYFASKFRQGYLDLEDKDVKTALMYDYDGYKFLREDDKDEYDTKILSSQIYNSLGIKTPIYFGAIDGQNLKYLANDNLSDYMSFEDKRYMNVISLDKETVERLKSIKSEFIGKYISGEVFNKWFLVNFFENKKRYANNDGYSNFVDFVYLFNSRAKTQFDSIFEENGMRKNSIVEYFNKEALKKKIKTGIIDLGLFVTNRKPNTFLYKLNQDNKIDDLLLDSITINYDVLSYYHTNDLNDDDRVFENDFEQGRLSCREIIHRYKTNERVNDVFAKQDRVDFAEDIVKIAESNIVRNIRDTIGYEINPKFNDVIKSHLNFVADELSK